MIRLALSGEVEKFRDQFRSWLKDNPPPLSGDDPSLDRFIDLGRAWQRRLAGGGWVGVHWPKQFGGRGLSLVEEAVVQEELVRADAPQLLGLFGLTMVGPVLIAHGSEAQRERYLKPILDGSEIWCQGFSEPGAGSDLAAIRTSAKEAAGGFVLSGQKIWTSFAQIAQWCFVLARTSSEGEKHRGLTYFLVDTKTSGITTRPLRQISGDREFNELFFDDVFVPAANVVGRVGEGWRIAISTLMYERVVLTFARQLQSEVALRDLIGRHRDKKDRALDRAKLGPALGREIARACAVRALAYEHLVDYSSGKSPGPEGSLDKLFWSESFQEIARLALQFRGREVAGGELDPAAGADVHRYLYSRGRTIAAGTSEIQRNIIAERVLGLPRLRYSKE